MGIEERREGKQDRPEADRHGGCCSIPVCENVPEPLHQEQGEQSREDAADQPESPQRASAPSDARLDEDTAVGVGQAEPVSRLR